MDFEEIFEKAFLKAALKVMLSHKLLSLLLVYIPATLDPGNRWNAARITYFGKSVLMFSVYIAKLLGPRQTRRDSLFDQSTFITCEFAV